jgi:phosphoglycolate phosphatase-like HAD superfamily hydrolase
VGSRPDLVKKPDPSMLQIAAEAINSPMETTMMIGDSEVDAATGIAANSVSVIVRGGYCHKPYEDLNVTHLLDSIEELLDIIDNQYLISD